MQSDSSKRGLSRRPSQIALGLVLAAIVGVLLFLLLRDDNAETAGNDKPAPGAVQRSGYRNRALWLPGPSAQEEEVKARPKITGMVYGTDGSAIPEATVVAMTFEVAGNVLSTVGSVKSDESGRFEIELPDGTYQLSASAEGRGATSATAHSGDTVSLVLPKSGVIEGRVVDEGGRPVERFTIDVLSAVPTDTPATPALFSRTFESEDGSFRVDQLPSWDIIVRATAADHAPAFSQPLLVRAEDVEKVDFTLSKGCILTGHVVDRSGAPLPDVFIDAESMLAAGGMDEMSMAAASQAQSEEDGSFTLTGVPKGAVVVRGYDGDNAVSTVNVEIAACDKAEPVKLVMSPGGSVSGVARTVDGEPVAGAKLSLMHRPIGFVNTTSDAEGRFHFEQVPSGTVRLMVQDGDQVKVTGVIVEDGKDTEQDMVLPPKGDGEIRGRVTAGGKPLPSARLMIATSIPQEGAVGLYYPVTAEDGSYRVSSLPPGVYLVNVVSTSTGEGVLVKPGEVATLDLKVADPPSVKAREAAMARQK